MLESLEKGFITLPNAKSTAKCIASGDASFLSGKKMITSALCITTSVAWSMMLMMIRNGWDPLKAVLIVIGKGGIMQKLLLLVTVLMEREPCTVYQMFINVQHFVDYPMIAIT